ncbi:General stress protein 14 [Kingella potus]|uniref:General stress protein 14 n=1 Tax=Kingella potus TaxID=265175 RepID=A0A377QYR7_9NEIS|nr:NAD(P)H-dependent oxidoreductase [Kingella potus]UOP01305.1 NAD(P)H-dependent oxidoreductase [Kingella potus]STR00383.1 General stress protein 14 [Kingella potus]
MTLLILAHPDYDKSVANKTIAERLQQIDPHMEIRNLSALYPDFRIDRAAEQQSLLRHRKIVFQYPFYWYNMPAILKQWFDHVLTHNFAYGSQGDKLKDKYLIASISVGSPEDQYQPLGKHHFPMGELCKNLAQTAYLAQMQFVPPQCLYGVAKMETAELQSQAAAHADRLHTLLNELP